MKNGKGCLSMLGRVVEHHSPARLTKRMAPSGLDINTLKNRAMADLERANNIIPKKKGASKGMSGSDVSSIASMFMGGG